MGLISICSSMPLSTQQLRRLTSASLTVLSSEFFCELWDSNPGQLGPKSSILTIVLVSSGAQSNKQWKMKHIQEEYVLLRQLLVGCSWIGKKTSALLYKDSSKSEEV